MRKYNDCVFIGMVFVARLFYHSASCMNANLAVLVTIFAIVGVVVGFYWIYTGARQGKIIVRRPGTKSA